METLEAKNRMDRLQSARRTVEGMWQEIERFVVPLRGEFFREELSEHQVEWFREDIFDSTAIMASKNLAASMQSNLTSSVVRWFDFEFRSKELNKNAEAKKWLQECAQRVWQALQDSNFSLESAEAYIDICSYGTACIVEETLNDIVWEGLDFSAIPIKECFFEEDWRGQVRKFYRRILWSPTQIVTKFGKENTPTEILEKVGATEIDHKIPIVFMVYDRPNAEKIDVSKPLAPKARPFGYKYFVYSDGTQLGPEGGYYEMPAFLPRWASTSGSAWGHSPATIALPDIKTLNKIVELILRAAEKVIDPATLVTERGLLSDLDLEPAGLTVVRSLDDLASYESKARFDVSHLEKTQLQESIRRMFFQDQLELKESPAMTATEVQVRYELMQRLIGPTLGRLQHDWLDPCVTRTFYILFRAGQLPPIPDALLEAQQAGQGELDIEYLGPMARSQKAETLTATNRWVQGLAGVAEMQGDNADILDNFDADEYARETAHYLSVPMSMVKPKDRVAAERKARAEQQAKALETAQQEAQGNAMKAQGEGREAMNGTSA